MLTGFKEILKTAESGGYAVPAFNVYNMETVMGVAQAAEEMRAPVIMQFYSRLATEGTADYLAPVILRAADKLSVPVCMHLDHGANYGAAAIAVRNGATGIMIDFSNLELEKNIKNTAEAVKICESLGVGVEGELGYIGKAVEGISVNYTTVKDAEYFVEKTGVAALAIAVGTAHGKYKQPPELAIDRIKEIHATVRAALVLHGGSGVPDEQIRAAVMAGIRKVNFGTDLCYAFLDGIFAADRNNYAIDLFMRGAIDAVKKFAEEKIALLGAEKRA